jgi:hypothetical protein
MSAARDRDNDSSASGRVPQLPEKKEDFDEYVIRMELYLDSKEVLDVVTKGVQTIPKDRAGTLDNAAVEAQKINHSAANLQKSKKAANIIIQSLPSKMINILSNLLNELRIE